MTLISFAPRHRYRSIVPLLTGGAIVFATTAAIAADGPAESFYQGRQISLVVGSAPGGGYDTYSRLLARHYHRHIPGDPNIVVQNMAGASGARALNYIYNVAPRDGSAIGIGQRATLVEPVYGSGPVKLDARKLSWIGGLNTEWSVGIVWHESGLTSLEDARQREFPVSASGASSDGYIYAAVLNNVLGTRFKIISGYSGTAEEQLAMERGEVAGRIGWAWGSIQSTAGDLVEEGLLKTVVLLAPERQTGFDAPLARDYAASDEQREILDFVFAPQLLGRPYFGPPGVPQARLATLREAFAETVQEAAFLRDAEKQKLEIQYVPAASLAALVERLYATPPEIIEKAKAARQYKGADGKLKAHLAPAAPATQTAERAGSRPLATPSDRSR